MKVFKILFLALLSAGLVACSDQRATFEIQGSSYSLSLIRITGLPWEENAKFSIVASHMPDCMRRHAMPDAPSMAAVEVYAPGNEAWILKQGQKMFVVETRTCEGFAALDTPPEEGLGPRVGVFQVKNDTLSFVVEPPPSPPPSAP